MESEILKAIVDLINTSPNHNAWLDNHPSSWLNEEGEVIAGFGTGMPCIHITGPVVDHWLPEEIKIEGVVLHIGPHKFDLQDPQSTQQIERMFGCDMEAKPQFDPIDAISNMIEEEI